MPIQLGASREHGFDEPLELLGDCHRRIELFLGMLRTVARQAGGEKLIDQQRRAAQAALEYFKTAAPRHTQDEEQSLFPLLRDSADPAALAAMESLHDEHLTAAAEHERVDDLFRHWLDDGSLPQESYQELQRLLDELTTMYSQHIGMEDSKLFPLAAQVLGPQELNRLGQEMAQRRGLTAGGTVQTEGDPARKTIHTIDVRPIPGQQRHPLIFRTFETLSPGEAIELINDHDPFPLRSQFNMIKRNQFSWDYLQQGPELWRVRIGRLEPSQTGS